MYELPDGQLAGQSGTFIFGYQTQAGCDSVLEIQLILKPLLEAYFTEKSCAGSSWELPWGGTVAAPGVYTHVYPYVSGCDSLRQTATFEYFPDIQLTAAVASPLCPGDETGTLSAEASGGSGDFLYALNGGVFAAQTVFENLEPGVYTLDAEDANGCAASIEALIEPPGVFGLSFDPAVLEIRPGDTVQLQALLDFLPDSIHWTASGGESVCPACLTPRVSPLRSTEYLLTLWTSEGCSVSATVRVRVDDATHVFVPNVFSPNDDGENDYFTVFTGPEVPLVRRLAVFDRWGGLVFEARDFAPGDAAGRWNGAARKREAGPGVYTWMCEVELADGSRKKLSGDVTLIR